MNKIFNNSLIDYNVSMGLSKEFISYCSRIVRKSFNPYGECIKDNYDRCHRLDEYCSDEYDNEPMFI